MRHQRSGKKLGRDSAHRKALYSNLAGALIEHGRIQTTEAKAKAVKPFAEKMITLGKRGDLHARRQALAALRSNDVVHRLFADVAPRFADRPGGYTRIVRLGPRQGDAAEMVYLELVDYEPAATPLALSRAQRATERPQRRARSSAVRRRRYAAGVLFLIGVFARDLRSSRRRGGSSRSSSARLLDIAETGAFIWWSKRRQCDGRRRVARRQARGRRRRALARGSGEGRGRDLAGALRRRLRSGHGGRRPRGSRASRSWSIRRDVGYRGGMRVAPLAALLAVFAAVRSRELARSGRRARPCRAAHRGRRRGRRERDRRSLGGFDARRAAPRVAPTRTRPLATAGGAFRTSRSASTTRWRSARAASSTCSAATPLPGRRSATAWCSSEGAWRALPRMPFPRAAAGAGVASGRIVVAGRHRGRSPPRRNALSFDLADAALVGRPRPDAARAPGRDRARGCRLRRRRADGRARHEPPRTSSRTARASGAGGACSRSRIRAEARARRGSRARSSPSAARSRGDDRGGPRLPRRRAPLGAAGRPADAEARRRSRRARRACLRHRRRARAGAHGQLGERVARGPP